MIDCSPKCVIRAYYRLKISLYEKKNNYLKVILVKLAKIRFLFIDFEIPLIKCLMISSFTLY